MDGTTHRIAMPQGERLRALGETATYLANDLNQSLALISDYSDMATQELLRPVPELGRAREMVGITARAAIEGGQALRGLLSFVRNQELLADAALTSRRSLSASDNPRKTAEKDVYEPQRRVRILVVENEQQLARMASLVLTQQGHEVVISPSARDALKKLQRDRFQLILSDFGLGSGKNGWDLAETVRERWPGTRFVLVAGWCAAIDPEEARTRGVHEVLAKPYRIADLRQVANRVAGGLDNE